MIETSSAPAAAKAAPRTVLSEENYNFLQRHVYNASGIVLDSSKLYLIESRLTPLVRTESIKSLDDLCLRIRANSTSLLSRRVVEAMTTNETLFFRDVATFDALRKKIIPRLLAAKGAARKLAIWSAASSTGQEAYSIAIMLAEMGIRADDVEILGTDLSEQVLDRAREAKYVQFEVNRGLPSPLLVKYFRQSGLNWELHESIRKMVTFRAMDLRQDMRSVGVFDLILCRNVLIYFDVETKKKIVEQMRRILYPHGTLVLGCAETVINVHDGFATESIDGALFYSMKKGGA
jgi:chemotaxis protein methyltransferase CheR